MSLETESCFLSKRRSFPSLRFLNRRSTSMMSDGSGEVSMDRLGEGQGKTKRVRASATRL